jgi:hypothetical protein
MIVAKQGDHPMNIRRSTLLTITGVLFCLAAAVAAFGKADDLGMGVVWLALGVTFFGLARSESKKTE